MRVRSGGRGQVSSTKFQDYEPPVTWSLSLVTSLHAAAFTRTAAVVRDRRHVDDGNDLESDRLEGADGGVAAEAGAGNTNDNVLQPMRHGVARGVLGDDLSGVRRGLAGAAEVAFAGGGPGDDGTLLVGDRDD